MALSRQLAVADVVPGIISLSPNWYVLWGTLLFLLRKQPTNSNCKHTKKTIFHLASQSLPATSANLLPKAMKLNHTTRNMVKKTTVKFKKAPGAPKRFKSAYMFFSENQHKVIRENAVNKKVSDPSASVG